ncbi:MAG: PilZ domain-containing protein [Halofilum sp. (in: g-proteobacteria)]
MSERRQSERHQLMFHARVIDAESDTTLGQLVDLSATGLMLASAVPLEVGRTYRLRIPLPVSFDGHPELRVRATVAWSAESLHPGLHRGGFRDLELPEEQRRAFERLVDEYRLRAAVE